MSKSQIEKLPKIRSLFEGTIMDIVIISNKVNELIDYINALPETVEEKCGKLVRFSGHLVLKYIFRLGGAVWGGQNQEEKHQVHGKKDFINYFNPPPMNLSKCCNAPVEKSWTNACLHYYCNKCRKSCDLATPHEHVHCFKKENPHRCISCCECGAMCRPPATPPHTTEEMRDY